MNIAVKKYQNVVSGSKRKNIPDVWPAEVLENVSSPPDGNWTIMTDTEFDNYKNTYVSDFTGWGNSYCIDDDYYTSGSNVCAICGKTLDNITKSKFGKLI